MRSILIFSTLLMALGCNRNQNRTITAAPAQPAPVPKVETASSETNLEPTKPLVTFPPIEVNIKLSEYWLTSDKIPTNDCAIGLIEPLDFESGAPPQEWIARIKWIDSSIYEDKKLLVSPYGIYHPRSNAFSVYAIRGNNCLMYGKDQKWGWLKFDKSVMRYRDLSNFDWIKIAAHSSDHRLLEAFDAAGPLRDTASDSGKIITRLEEKPWAQADRLKIATEKAGNSKLNGTWVQILEQQNDWIRVRLPKSEHIKPESEEGTYGVYIDWDPKLEGWIRWRRPGPVKDSRVILLQMSEVGFYD